MLDLDGTLYDAPRMRRLMFLKLAGAYALRPLEGWRVSRVLRGYRRAQEALRLTAEGPADLETLQRELAARASGCDIETVAQCVERWMRREPDGVLRRCMDPGVPEFLEKAAAQGLGLAVLSDYPAESKLEAMGIRSFFQQVVIAQDPEVLRFKPDPRGLEIAMRRLGVAKEETLYVGDRFEVDGVAARRAGVACVLVGVDGEGRGWPSVRKLGDLRHALEV